MSQSGTFTPYHFELITYDSEIIYLLSLKQYISNYGLCILPMLELTEDTCFKKKILGTVPRNVHTLRNTVLHDIPLLSLQLIPPLPNHSSMFLECD